MSDNFQEPPSPPPPPYAEVVEKSVPPVFGERAVMYTAPPQEQVGAIRYQTVNPPTPMAYGVHAVPMVTFDRYTISCICTHCRSTIVTRTEQTNGLLAWIMCLFLCICGCWLGCCLIPFCIQDLQNVQHYCPHCHALLGEYRPF